MSLLSTDSECQKHMLKLQIWLRYFNSEKGFIISIYNIRSYSSQTGMKKPVEHTMGWKSTAQMIYWNASRWKQLYG